VLSGLIGGLIFLSLAMSAFQNPWFSGITLESGGCVLSGHPGKVLRKNCA
jgi:hypothetical protein